MPGIIEKGTNGNALFSNQIEFVGKYAKYVVYLKDETNFFPTYVEIYVISAILGFLVGKKGTYEGKASDDTKSVFVEQIVRHRADLKFIYRIIMLLDDADKLSLEDRKNRAFRDDPETNGDIIKANMKLFNEYVCGGLEYLYNELQVKDADDLAEKVKKAKDFIYLIAVQNNLIEDKDLPSFSPQD